MIRKNSSFSISTLFPDILIKNNHELNIIEKEKRTFFTTTHPIVKYIHLHYFEKIIYISKIMN